MKPETNRRPVTYNAIRLSLIFSVLCVFHYRHLLPHFSLGFTDRPVLVSDFGSIDLGHPYFVNQTTARDPLSEIGLPTIHPDPSRGANGSSAMVASDVPYCSQLGTDILRAGGNAADAAVTIALCIGSVNSHSSGIGGGSFIISRHNNHTLSIDSREMAPAASFRDMYKNNSVLAKVGGLAVGIPGELAGLYELFSTHGSGNISWKELIEPVIQLNLKGFAATPVLVHAIESIDSLVLSRVPTLKENWGFLYHDSLPIQPGHIISRPAYAKTLQLIANNGSSAVFYDPEGPIAPSLVSSISKYLGIMTTEDFAAYKVQVEEPITLDFQIEEMGGLNFFSKVFHPTDTPALFYHKLIESFKWLASIRTNLGELNTDREKVAEKYLGDSWIEDVLKQGKYSDDKTFPFKNYDPKFELREPKGTSHFSVVDHEGNAVGMTTTVNLYFGSLVLDPATGIILNNQMDDFSIPNEPNSFNLVPCIYNYVHPFKRPLSSTSPTIVTKDNQVVLVIGAAGGSRIPTAILHAIIRIFYKGHSLLESISYPRVHHQLVPEVVHVENVTVISEEYPGILTSLAQLGHNFTETGAATAMNGISREGGVWSGVSDYWRKLGQPKGY